MVISKFILSLALLIPLSAAASTTFFWRAEGTTLSATDDKSPDTSATANGGVSISAAAVKVGTNGILTTDQQDYYIFDSTGICDETQGTLAGWINYRTAAPTVGANIVRCTNTGNSSSVNVKATGGQEFRIELTETGGSTISLTTNTCNIVADTWYYVVGSWHITNDDRTIACYNSSGALIDSEADLTTDLSLNAPGVFDELRVGNSTSHTGVVWVDNAFAANTYGEPLENFHSITSYVPTYTAGPTNGTFTNTTLPFTYTPGQNGTTYGAACTNGQTITTFANLKSGTCSGGAAVGTGTDTSVATVSDTVIITGLVASTIYDVYIGHESSIGGQSTIASLPNSTTTGSSINFSVGPSEAPATNGFTISGTITCSGTCTVEAVACNPGDAVPSNTELEAGQCGGGNAALMNAQEVWTTGVGNDFLLTSANKPVRFDVYVAGTDGTNDTSVNSFLNQDRSLRSGFGLTCPTGIATTSIFDLDTYFTPDFAAAMCTEFEDDTNEDVDCNISFEIDGDFTLTPVAAGDCDSRRSFEISYQDTANATNGLFTAPTVGNFTTDDTIYVNDPTIICNNDDVHSLLLTLNQAMSNIDMDNFCSHSIDQLSYTVTTGTLNTGLTLTAGTGVLSGTPTVQNEAGNSIRITGTNVPGATNALDWIIYVTDNSVTIPDCVNDTVTACVADLNAVRPWQDNAAFIFATFAYSGSVAVNNIISQTPTYPGTMTATANMDVVVSLGPQPVSGNKPIEELKVTRAPYGLITY
jgi:hypothetical protein